MASQLVMGGYTAEQLRCNSFMMATVEHTLTKILATPLIICHIINNITTYKYSGSGPLLLILHYRLSDNKIGADGAQALGEGFKLLSTSISDLTTLR